MPAILRALAALVVLVAPLAHGEDFFEQAPVNYSAGLSNDPVARLAREWQQGRETIAATEPLGFLRELLKRLNVPAESQVLVFSKTSKQNSLITPQTPRAIYFSDDTYVGFVPGGAIEIIATDPLLGPVFYLLELPGARTPATLTRSGECLECHASARTEGVPGMQVRSVLTAADGRPILSAGTHDTTHASPLAQRWGGWFVTGDHGTARHQGNLTADPDNQPANPDRGANWTTLDGKIDTTRYLRPTSDIVALMVLEHQCRMHNLLTKASMEYRRALWLCRTLNPDVTEEDTTTSAHRVATGRAAAIVAELLFRGEAPPGPDGVEGDPAFQLAFAKNAPATPDGHSLKDFRLYGRIFKNRCSYMIHSSAFASLPPKIRSLVFADLRAILLNSPDNPDFAYLPASERRRIANILDATLPAWRN
jgi:hypothetical protein